MAPATAAAKQETANALPLITEDQLKKDFAHVEDAIQKLEKRGTDDVPSVFEDDDDLDAARAFAPDLRKAIKRINDLRELTKAPFLTAGNLVQSHFKALEKRVADIDMKINAAATSYLNKKAARAAAEQRRIEAEQRAEAARLASEAAQQAAAGKLQEAVQTQTASEAAGKRAEVAADLVDARPAERARTTTASGTSTLVENFGFKIVDRTKIDAWKLLGYFTDTELNAALGRFVKQGGRELAGVEIFPDHKARL
jgi:hypothetical protein